MAFMRAMACAALTSATGLIRGMSPRYRRTLPPVASTLSPSHEGREGGDAHLLGQGVHPVVVRADEARPHVDRHAAWEVWVQTRPPTRSRASSTTTDRPAWERRRAAVSPARPAPTTQTSASIVSGLVARGHGRHLLGVEME